MRSASLLRSCILVLALAPFCAEGRAATLSERAAQIDGPALGGYVTLAGPLAVGRAEIAPAKGTRVRALLAGGVPCGLVFEGPAQLRYRVEDRFSAPVAERNVRRFSTLKTKPVGGERATIEITVDVPEPWTPFASGAEISRTAQGGRHKLSVRLEQPMQFAVVTVGKYKTVEETQEGVTCRAATYAMLKEDAARKIIQKFFSGRRFFERPRFPNCRSRRAA
jgi:hypothetical protein